MDVILLERVSKLGQMGEVVRVKDGYARNFLMPKGKALRATKENRARFEGMKTELQARNLERKSEAEVIAKQLDGRSVIALRQAGEFWPALWIRLASRHRQPTGRGRLCPRAWSNRAEHPGQGARPAPNSGDPPPGGVRQHHPEHSPNVPRSRTAGSGRRRRHQARRSSGRRRGRGERCRGRP